MSDPGEPLVVDASVAVKWVIPENHSDEAARLLGRPLVAPDLIFAECANILWKSVHRGEMSADEAAVAAQTLETAELRVVATRPYLARAVAIAAELDHPAYDAVYLAVAESLGLRFATADDGLIRRIRGARTRFRPLVLPIAELD